MSLKKIDLGYLSVEELNEIGFRKIGNNLKISRFSNFYCPEKISMGDNIRIDDFCVISGAGSIDLGDHIHIGAHCLISGSGGLIMEDFSGLSGRVSVYTSTEDLSGKCMTGPMIDKKYTNFRSGPVKIMKHVSVGTNSTIMPFSTLRTGAAFHANSFILGSYNEFGIYAGKPAIKIKDRYNKLLELEREFLDGYRRDNCG